MRTGLQLLQAVRAREQSEDIPFVMASAKGSHTDILLAAKEKASQHRIKPFSENALREKLKGIGFP